VPGLRQLTPIDTPMVPFALAGMAAWLVAWGVLALLRGTLEAHGHQEWLTVCWTGFLLGLPGLATMVVHDRGRRRRAAARRAGTGQLDQDSSTPSTSISPSS
jgi:hypothetical protein